MDSFRINYGEFNKDLIAFVELVSQRYKTGAPEVLQYIKLIPTVLTTSDPALATGNIKTIEYKFIRLQTVIKYLFKYLPPCVREEFSEWVHNQIRKLDWWIDITEMSLSYAAKIAAENDNVTVISAGISGINRGVVAAIEIENWKKIEELWYAIQTFAYQMRC